MSERTPFFILGSGRCGSTRLYEILREHPRIALTDEARVADFLHFVVQLAALPVDEVRRIQLEEFVEIRGVLGRGYTEPFADQMTRYAKRILPRFYEELFEDKQFTHWGDKLPNPMAALAVSELYPDTRYIVLVRDPRDYLCSVRSYVERPEIALKHPYLAKDLAGHCAHWRNVYDGVERYLPRRCTIRYEDLVADPHQAVQLALDDLDLPMDPACARAIAAPGSFASRGTSAAPFESVGRHRRELDDAERRQVESICGDVMERHGYRPSTVGQ